MLFLGVDWAEANHDVLLMDEAGEPLGRARVPDGLEGLRRVHELVGAHLGEGGTPEEVVVGIETERGLLVRGLLAAGYTLYALNPLAVARYRERHATSGAKSDAADAKVLADLVRTDRHNHRPLAPDSERLEALRALARAHQGMVWARQRQIASLRSGLREYFPGALVAFPELGSAEALEVLALAPTPEHARALSRAKVASALRRAGRTRRVEQRAAEIQAALRAEQPEAPELVAEAYGRAAAASCAVARTLGEQVGALEAELAERFVGTRTPPSSSACPGSGRCWAPGCSRSSATPRGATTTGAAAGTMPAWRPSPAPRGEAAWSWPATPETAGWPMPATSGPSARSPRVRARGATTTPCGPGARPTARRFASWPTAGWASSTAAWSGGRPTASRWPGQSPRTGSRWPLDSSRRGVSRLSE